MRYRVSWLVALCVVEFGLFGCSTAPRFMPGKEIGVPDSQVLCDSLNTSRQSIASFRTLLNTTVLGPDESPVSFRYAMVGREKEALRIDILPHEGAYTLALIVIRGQEAMYLDTQAKVAASGCSVDDVLEQFLGVEGLSMSAVQALVTGQVPQLDCEGVSVFRADNNRVLFVRETERIAWEVDGDTGELTAVYFISEDQEVVTAIARREHGLDRTSIEVRLYRPVDASASMEVQKLIVNPDVPDHLFQVAIPQGYQRESCSGR